MRPRAEFAIAEATLSDLMCAGVAESLGPEIDSATAKVPELVVQLVRAGRALSGADVMAAWTRRDRLRASLIQRVSDYDAVLTFAAAGPAPPRSEGTGDPIFATLWTLQFRDESCKRLAGCWLGAGFERA
jgi:Asp-tRNA(Asn)/Glu-tRNA(Gln) amidotransferase A subunit family amidase